MQLSTKIFSTKVLSIYLSLSVCLSIYRICLTYCFPFFSTVPRFFDLASCTFKLTLVVVLISLYTFLSLNWVIKLLQDEALSCSGLILHNLLTDERGLALFPAGNIVRDPHHCKSLINHKHDLNLRRRFKSCLRHVRDSRWWWSLILISVGNNASRCLSLVNHTTKTINYFGGIWLKNSNKSDESLFLFDKSIFFFSTYSIFSLKKNKLAMYWSTGPFFGPLHRKLFSLYISDKITAWVTSSCSTICWEKVEYISSIIDNNNIRMYIATHYVATFCLVIFSYETSSPATVLKLLPQGANHFLLLRTFFTYQLDFCLSSLEQLNLVCHFHFVTEFLNFQMLWMLLTMNEWIR